MKDTRVRLFLTRALQASYRVESAKSLPELEERLADPPPPAFLLDPLLIPASRPGGRDEPLILDSLRGLRGRHRESPMMIASDFTGREMEVFHLGRMEVDGVLQLERNPTPRDIQDATDRAFSSALARRVAFSIETPLSPEFRNAVRWAIEHAESSPKVGDLAEALGSTPRRLARGMRMAGLCSPRSLLLWGRLIRASQLLQNPSETTESVAFRMGYSTGGALGKAFKRVVGSSPASLLLRGGLSWTLKVFQREGLHPPQRPKP